MRKVLRLIGWVFVLLAAALLGRDLWPVLTSGEVKLRAGGDLWIQIDPGSLNGLQAGVERYIDPALWEGVIFPILQLPAFLPLLGFGGLLLLVTWKGRRHRRR